MEHPNSFAEPSCLTHSPFTSFCEAARPTFLLFSILYNAKFKPKNQVFCVFYSQILSLNSRKFSSNVYSILCQCLPALEFRDDRYQARAKFIRYRAERPACQLPANSAKKPSFRQNNAFFLTFPALFSPLLQCQKKRKNFSSLSLRC